MSGNSSHEDYNTESEAFVQEIQHLRKKIRNIQESIQLSVNIAQPSVWRTNCLNAVANIVVQWRSIVSYYEILENQNDHGEQMDDPLPILHPENEWCKGTAILVFGIIQMALQSGPLKGSNAGYFKRCGAVVAKMAEVFLNQCCLDDVVDGVEGVEYHVSLISEQLLFTAKQKELICKWLTNANKTVTSGKSPSKSALKLQSQVNKKKAKKERRKNK